MMKKTLKGFIDSLWGEMSAEICTTIQKNAKDPTLNNSYYNKTDETKNSFEEVSHNTKLTPVRNDFNRIPKALLRTMQDVQKKSL